MATRRSASICTCSVLAGCLWMSIAMGDEVDTQPAPPEAAQPALAAVITDSRLAEISGLAASKRHPDVFWVHNDSGDDAVIHAVASDGEHLAEINIDGATHTDWEDIASFELDGKPYLMIGDIGDNGGLREQLTLWVIEEPETLEDGRASLAWSQTFRWPDGARDAEALAVDAEAGRILVLSKRRVPAQLCSIPLSPDGDGTLEAEPEALLTDIPQPGRRELESNPKFGRYQAQVTAADLSPDGLALAVLTYRSIYLYRRSPGEPWGKALQRPGQPIAFAGLPQAEGLAFDAGGDRLWVTSEKLPAALVWVGIKPETRVRGDTD